MTVDDLVRAVSVALGALPPPECAAADADGDGQVTIADLVVAVGRALDGCRTGA